MFLAGRVLLVTTSSSVTRLTKFREQKITRDTYCSTNPSTSRHLALITANNSFSTSSFLLSGHRSEKEAFEAAPTRETSEPSEQLILRPRRDRSPTQVPSQQQVDILKARDSVIIDAPMKHETIDLLTPPISSTTRLADEVLLSLNADRESEEAPMTQSQMIEFLKQNNVYYDIMKFTNTILLDCDKCGAPESQYASAADGHLHCVNCHTAEPFLHYKKRVVLRTTETTLADEIKTEEERRIEEQLQRMDSPEQIDDDLHDRMSALNLMTRRKDLAGQRKSERMRQFRDDTEAETPRDNFSSGYDTGGPMAIGVTGVGAGAAMTDPVIRDYWDTSMDINDLSDIEYSAFTQLRLMLGIENISMDTLTRYNVRIHTDSYDHVSILYPRYRGQTSRLRTPLGLKVIRKVGDRMEKENHPIPDEQAIRQRFSGIFGYQMMTNSDHRVVLTTNERDALAVYEATGMLAFALPMGERLDQNVIPYLEDMDMIYLWFPHRHQDYAKDWGYALNGLRCFLIKSPERPIELIRNGNSRLIKQHLRENAVRMRDKGFRSMTDIRDEVKADLVHNSTRIAGFAQWKRFSVLNRYLGGFRPGELTVLTGGTGFGKTTFLCEYSLDLFQQGVRTLFCSFEMPEEKILKWMLVQYAGIPLYRVQFSASIDSWLDKFERTKGPLTIMKSDEFRDKSINTIANSIRHHVEASGIQHVVIDNLQFLVNQCTMVGNDKSSSFDRFHLQDRFVGHMRQLATEMRIHITMVVHPRKVDSDTDLDIQHFGGSARVTQEADNVLAIQRRRSDTDRRMFKKFLYILKNRYGGRRVETDQIEMVFNAQTYTHTLIDHS